MAQSISPLAKKKSVAVIGEYKECLGNSSFPEVFTLVPDPIERLSWHSTGAGPAGLTTAKALLDVGLEPHVFEAKRDVGGLWAVTGTLGQVYYNMKSVCWYIILSFRILESRSALTCHPTMRTNISRWSCSFSDLAWKEKHFCDVENLKKHGHGKFIHMRPLELPIEKGGHIIDVCTVLIMIFVCKKRFLSFPRQGMSTFISKIMLPNISPQIGYH